MNPFAKKVAAATAGAPEPAEIKTAVRVAIAEEATTEDALDQPIPPEVIAAAQLEDRDDVLKLSKLIDDDFPFRRVSARRDRRTRRRQVRLPHGCGRYG
jgi:hypothetical protein